MDFIRRVSYLFLIFILKSSSIFAKEPEHIVLADRITQKFIQEMEDKFGWVCTGTGGSMPTRVNSFHISFDLPRRATIDEGRALEIMAIERLIEIVNADEKIRPYLCEYPFPTRGAQISLSFRTGLGLPCEDGNVYSIFQARDLIFYRAKDPESETSFPLLEESYSDAKQIASTLSSLSLLKHEEKPHEALIDAIFASYLKQMNKEFGLKCERVGGKLTDAVDQVVARLVLFRPTKIERARELQVIATQKLLDAFNSNQELRPYIKNYPLTLDRLSVVISFRNSRYFSFSDGTVESVSQKGEEVIYRSEDEDKEDTFNKTGISKPDIVIKEPYQEALVKVRNSRIGKKLKI